MRFNENPIFAGSSYSSSSGHAVVIRGFYVNSNSSEPGSISYMDPAVGYMVSSRVPKDKDFAYCPAGSTTRYNFNGFAAVSR